MPGLIKLTTESLRYIALFETLTGAIAKDCVIDNENNRVIFVVRRGDMGKAIGRRGSNIMKVRKSIGLNVEVVEYADNPTDFLKNVFLPARVKSVRIVERRDGSKVAYVEVEERDKGLAIGKNGKNIHKAKMLAKRHFDINDVIIV